MKFLYPIFVLLLVSCGGNDVEVETENTIETIDSTYCDCNELVFDEQYNHFWRFNRRDGYFGKCEVFYSNGQVKETRLFENGKNHGKFFYYYENGQVKEEKQFDMNFQIGEQITYSETGDVIFHALYKRGNQTEILVNRPDLK